MLKQQEAFEEVGPMHMVMIDGVKSSRNVETEARDLLVTNGMQRLLHCIAYIGKHSFRRVALTKSHWG